METEALRVRDLPPNHKARPPSALLCITLPASSPLSSYGPPCQVIMHVLSVLVSYIHIYCVFDTYCEQIVNCQRV